MNAYQASQYRLLPIIPHYSPYFLILETRVPLALERNGLSQAPGDQYCWWRRDSCPVARSLLQLLGTPPTPAPVHFTRIHHSRDSGIGRVLTTTTTNMGNVTRGLGGGGGVHTPKYTRQNQSR